MRSKYMTLDPNYNRYARRYAASRGDRVEEGIPSCVPTSLLDAGGAVTLAGCAWHSGMWFDGLFFLPLLLT